MVEKQIVSEGIKVTNELFNYGVLGLFCIFLIIILYFVWRTLKEDRKEFVSEVKLFRETMNKHSVNEAMQTQVLAELKDFILKAIIKLK